MTTTGYIEMLKAVGFQVYVRKMKDTKYCYVTDGTHIAYVQWGDRPGVSTVHMPNRTTGTGYHFSDAITPKNVRKAMVTVAPG